MARSPIVVSAVGMVSPAGRDAAGSCAAIRAGIEWWIEPDPANTDIKFIPHAQRPKLVHPETPLSSSGVFENRIHLPQVGGDKYVVKVAKKHQRANFLATDPIETWRKIYYSVYYAGNPALNLFNNLEPKFKQAFADEFIEAENLQKTAALTVLARLDVTSASSFGRPFLHFLGGAAAPGGIIDLIGQRAITY